MKKTLFLAAFIMLLFSCVEEANPSHPLVLKSLEDKKASYLKEVLERCKTEAITMAELYVDSLLSEQIQLSVNDSINFPPKPVKPPSKGPIHILNFIKAEPIFNDSVLIKWKKE